MPFKDKGNPQGMTRDLFAYLEQDLDSPAAAVCRQLSRAFQDNHGRGKLGGGTGVFDMTVSAAEAAVGPDRVGWLPTIEGGAGMTFQKAVVPASAELALASRKRKGEAAEASRKVKKLSSISDYLNNKGALANSQVPDWVWNVPSTATPKLEMLIESDVSFWGDNMCTFALQKYGGLNLGLPLCRRWGLLAHQHFPLLPDVGNQKSKSITKGCDRDLGKFVYDKARNRLYVRARHPPTPDHTHTSPPQPALHHPLSLSLCFPAHPNPPPARQPPVLLPVMRRRARTRTSST